MTDLKGKRKMKEAGVELVETGDKPTRPSGEEEGPGETFDDEDEGARRGKKSRGAPPERIPTLRLLDVGALSGTAYASYPWIRATSIDINPRGPAVHKYDFFDLPEPSLSYSEAVEREAERRRRQRRDSAADETQAQAPKGTRAKKKLAKMQREREAAEERWLGPFDVVSLSLVVNFLGDLSDRGRMLHHAHRYLVPRGWLYLVLPLACVENSRYLDETRLRAILDSCGFDVVRHDDSSRLSRWLCRRKEEGEAGWDGRVFKKEQVRAGVKRNNFAIVLNR